MKRFFTGILGFLFVSTASFHSQAGNPKPAICSQVTVATKPKVITKPCVEPLGAEAGDPDTTVTLFGSNFLPTSIVRWNGVDRVTTLDTDPQTNQQVLKVVLTASDLKDISSTPNKLSVFNPTSGGGISNDANFVVWPKCGSERGAFDGIPANSNGRNTTTGASCASSGLWQCVEYVKRYYADALGVLRAKQWKGDAKDYFDSAQQDIYSTDKNGKPLLDKNGKPVVRANNKMLNAYPNGDVTAPAERDIIVFSTGYGHVAIIKSIEPGCTGTAATKTTCKVTVIEQNWSKAAYGDLTLTRSSNSTYALDRGTSAYKVIGWLRAPDANAKPVGNFDEIRMSDGVIRGWSYDPDQPGNSINIQIFFNGPVGTGTLVHSGATNVLRADVNSTFGITGNHGFEFTIPATYRDGKPHSVYVYGIDLNDSTKSTLLGGLTPPLNSFTLTPSQSGGSVQWTSAQGGNGHWYRLVANNFLLWPAARARAAAMGGYLATLTTAVENDWVRQNVLPASPPGTSPWIGAADFALSGNWSWVEGPEAGQLFWTRNAGTISFSNWGPGEPNNCCAGPEFWLAVIPSTGKWIDLFAAAEPFIIEFDSAPTVFDAVNDFSMTSNPAGPWSYGYTTGLGGSFSRHATPEFNSPPGVDDWASPGIAPFFKVSKNSTGATIPGNPPTYTFPPDMLFMHPTSGGLYDVVRWTAPTSGNYSFQGKFAGLDFVTAVADTDVHVLRGSLNLVPPVVLHGVGTEQAFSFNLFVNGGDAIDFAVGIGPSGFVQNDSTGLKVLITPSNLSNGWRMSGHDGSRTNVSSGRGLLTLPTFQPIINSVAGSFRLIGPDGSLIFYAGDQYGGTLSSYDGTGAFRWANSTAINDVAIRPDGTIITSSLFSGVNALNKDTGQPVWATPFTSGIAGNETSALAIDSQGVTYINTGASFVGVPQRLTAIKPDGSLKWQSALTFRGYVSPVLASDESSVLIPTCNLVFPGGICYPLVVDLSASAGQQIGAIGLAGLGAVAPWGSAYFTPGTVLGQQGLFECAPNGSGCTQFVANEDIRGVATFIGSKAVLVYANTSTSFVFRLQAIDRQTGNPIWTAAENLSSPISDVNGTLYAIAPDTSDLVAFNGLTGLELWRQHFSSSPSNLILSDDGKLHFTVAGTLYRSSGPN